VSCELVLLFLTFLLQLFILEHAENLYKIKMSVLTKQPIEKYETVMAKVKIKDMSIDDLENFIEQKLFEIIGDPDSGLQLKEEFKKKLKKRLRKQSERISHKEVMKRFG